MAVAPLPPPPEDRDLGREHVTGAARKPGSTVIAETVPPLIVAVAVAAAVVSWLTCELFLNSSTVVPAEMPKTSKTRSR